MNHGYPMHNEKSQTEGELIMPESRLFVETRANISWSAMIIFLTYEGRSFKCVIWVLQGGILIPFIFRLLQTFKVFSLDRNHFLSLENHFVEAEK